MIVPRILIERRICGIGCVSVGRVKGEASDVSCPGRCRGPGGGRGGAERYVRSDNESAGAPFALDGATVFVLTFTALGSRPLALGQFDSALVLLLTSRPPDQKR